MGVAEARYLLGRGIERETAATFRLGVVSDPIPGHERFRDWLAIPYLHYEGYPLTIRFRCMRQHDHREFGHGKYMSLPGDPARVFNARAIKLAETDTDADMHITEGEFDAILLNQLGLNAIAIPGASGFRDHHRILVAGFNKVYVWGDPDDAGADFTNRVCRSVRSAKGVRLRDGDVTETFLAANRDPRAIYDLIGDRRSSS